MSWAITQNYNGVENMKYYAMLVSLRLMSCGENQFGTEKDFIEYGEYCPVETIEKRASFTLECIKNGNPKSDEEPEDWIRICKDMAKDLYCTEARFNVTRKCYDRKKSECRWGKYYSKIINKVKVNE